MISLNSKQSRATNSQDNGTKKNSKPTNDFMMMKGKTSYRKKQNRTKHETIQNYDYMESL